MENRQPNNPPTAIMPGPAQALQSQVVGQAAAVSVIEDALQLQRRLYGISSSIKALRNAVNYPGEDKDNGRPESNCLEAIVRDCHGYLDNIENTLSAINERIGVKSEHFKG